MIMEYKCCIKASPWGEMELQEIKIKMEYTTLSNKTFLQGWREVPSKSPEVPRTDLRMYDGLVPALAEGRSYCRGWPLPVQL